MSYSKSAYLYIIIVIHQIPSHSFEKKKSSSLIHLRKPKNPLRKNEGISLLTHKKKLYFTADIWKNNNYLILT